MSRALRADEVGTVLAEVADAIGVVDANVGLIDEHRARLVATKERLEVLARQLLEGNPG